MHELVNGIVPIEAGEQERLIQVDDLRETTQRLYEAVGVPRADARLMADLQVETDVRGVHSHGTRAVPRLLKAHSNWSHKSKTRNSRCPRRTRVGNGRWRWVFGTSGVVSGDATGNRKSK